MRTVRFFILYLFFCISIHAEEKTDTIVTVNGFLKDKTSKEALPGASVRMGKAGTTTDPGGFFSIRCPKNHIRLEMSFIGYVTKTLSFNYLTKDTFAGIIYLERSNSLLPEVIVSGSDRSQTAVHSAQPGKLEMSREAIKAIPALFGESDVIKALQVQPGVSGGMEGFAGMYVRGGTGYDNLFMIDGHPVYQMNHLGGLFSAFNTEATDYVTFYKSGFPAQYGGRLSSVTDIRTRDGDPAGYHGSAMLGLTSGNVSLSGPLIKDKTAFNLSARRSWTDVLSIPVLGIKNSRDRKDGMETTGGYSFTDLNMKLNHRFNENNKVYLLFYFCQDDLKSGEKFFSSEKETDEANGFYENGDALRLRWNDFLSAWGWSYRLNSKLSGRISGSYTRYSSLSEHSVFNSSGKEGTEDYASRGIKKSTDNRVDDTGAGIHFDYYPAARHRINFGTNFIRHRFRPGDIRSETSGGDGFDVYRLTDVLSGNEFNVYMEEDWVLSNVFRVNMGLRSSLFSMRNSSYFSLEPRLSGRVLLNRDLSLKLSYSRMNQYSQQLSESYISLPTDTWVPASGKFRPLASDQYSAGVCYDFRRGCFFSLDGYYKRMENLLEYRDGYELLSFYPSAKADGNSGWEDKITSGKGRSYGMEVTVAGETGKARGGIGYSLMWSEREFAEINMGRVFPSKYDNRHKVNITGSWKINDRTELTGSWVYMTGNRVTLPVESYRGLATDGFTPEEAPVNPYENEFGMVYYERKNNVRLPAYHRLDIGLNIYRQTKRGCTGIWNVSLYNAYSRMNPIAIRREGMYGVSGNVLDTGSRDEWDNRFRAFSIFPVVPSVSYMLKF
ncbi:Outer membrane receptor for ferrienterochelin and colicins [Bacteroidales bacterium Barb7]|nr:Outer membrane receptor for ferrienterochelin and colicins [Bacteroidales bacterium Barb7]OAV76292.1 Outer membrane receptor for ferrienterochelin and colicins [Bacteroidales bacterium Barb7]OAV76328.1 Outer membrane receptor for ferrienterochelin and colicins [Bacteroidales bacterium Barb7]